MTRNLCDPRNNRCRLTRQRGAVTVLSAFLLVVMLALVALAVDIGYIVLVRTQAQATADASALAAAGALYAGTPELQMQVYYAPNYTLARQTGKAYVEKNFANGKAPTVNLNEANDPSGDIVLGRIDNPSDLSQKLDPTSEFPNSVLVRVPFRHGHANGAVSLSFAPVLGFSNTQVHAAAVATVEYPTLLPIGTSVLKWETLRLGGDGDGFAYDQGDVSSGPDGIPEIDLFSGKDFEVASSEGEESELDGLLDKGKYKNLDPKPPGNFGWLKIGPVQSAATLRQQIDLGPSQSQFDAHDGAIHAGDIVNGKPGLVASAKTALNGGTADGRVYHGIIGQPRYMPIYSSVSGSGANAEYVIAGFVAVRVMHADLTSNPKRLVVQPIGNAGQLVPLRLTR